MAGSMAVHQVRLTNLPLCVFLRKSRRDFLLARWVILVSWLATRGSRQDNVGSVATQGTA